jgi:hypothetical protein
LAAGRLADQEGLAYRERQRLEADLPSAHLAPDAESAEPACREDWEAEPLLVHLVPDGDSAEALVCRECQRPEHSATDRAAGELALGTDQEARIQVGCPVGQADLRSARAQWSASDQETAPDKARSAWGLRGPVLRPWASREHQRLEHSVAVQVVWEPAREMGQAVRAPIRPRELEAGSVPVHGRASARDRGPETV